MEIIKKGKSTEGMIWTGKFKCTGFGHGGHGCKAKLLLNEKDIYMTYSYHYDWSSDSYYTFTCPCCGIETDINPEKIPYTVSDRLVTKKEWLKTQN